MSERNHHSAEKDNFPVDGKATDSVQDNSKDRKPCPEDDANCLSTISFWWMNWILFTGFKRPLEETDLWALNKKSRAAYVVPRLRSIWNNQKIKRKRAAVVPVREEPVTQRETDPLLGDKDKEIRTKTKRKRPSLVKALLKMFALNFFAAIVFKLFQDCLIFVQPQLLRLLIDYIEGKNYELLGERAGYVFAASMFVAALLQSILLHQYFHTMFTLGMRLRSAITGMVYEKALILNTSSRMKSTTGEIVNLMSVDAQRLTDVLPYINLLWSAPFQIGVALYFLHRTMGWPIYAGLGVMVIFTPLNILITRSINKYQVKQMTEKDDRIKMINEVLNGIKVLKFYAWEESFLEKINSKRSKELNYLLKSRLVGALLTLVFTTLPVLVAVTAFTFYVLFVRELTAAKAFVALSLFGIMSFPLRAYPNVLSACVQARVSIKRLEEFLDMDELDPDNVQRISSNLLSPGMVSVRDGVFGWNRTSPPILRSINVNIPSGSLVAVVGQVGSGKSTLLSALLGETEKLDGNVCVDGTMAYVSQQAWIQNGTVRDNILFSSSLECNRYERVIDCCALKPDLEILPAADLTEIGERGINLSGGQKQRISLARAVYFNADIYLLDDPLSAVDAHVGRKLFRDVIGPNGLLKDKTRILVTHSISFLPQMDHIIVLQNGFVSEEGTYSELLQNSGAFAEFLQTYSSEENGETESNGELDGEEASLKKDESTSDGNEIKPTDKGSCSTAKLTDLGKITTEETVEKGRVKFSLLLSYIKSTGIHWFIFSLFFYSTMEACTVATGVWLAKWTSTDITTHAQRNLYLIVYGSIGGGQALFSLFYSITLLIGSIRASRRLHLKLLVNILRLPMSFFDVTPLGRIMNRLSKDIYGIDVKIPMSLRSFLLMFFDVLGMLVAVSYATPLFLCVIPPLGLIYFFVQRVYVATSRQLRRIESANRSPIYSHFLETINGTTTIRAFSQQQRFIRENYFKVDEYQVAYYLEVSANRWLSLRIEFIGNLLIFFAALFAVLSRDKIAGGLVGLSVTYALQITNKLNWMIRMTSELETNLVAVERIAEYCDIPTEAERIIPDRRPVPAWPHQGLVQFHDFEMRYREGLPLVLKDINFVIKPAEKIGIVGRTGAGKSTLTLALFRILERTGGRIVIDGIDIAQIGLQDLRSRLTIIPQEPVLFSGSLRMNLDPFDKHSDEELWNVLEVSHLRKFVSGLNGGLMYPVAEGGENLSVGQRQLMCLARALLRKTKVLVLDEATAAVDLETDELIQQTIRREFADRTVLTIAHRLNTIMDYDRVMVLESGSIVEFDSPSTLLARKGQFFGMVRDARLNVSSINSD
ncbi:multidrug resistance-associated protein 1-like [Montipora foliosa]|uniref:multidrug resistance-associated protein 1-like n=1 Tax=Montipora foliosa TaxID=591990 RepID=UPI0035F143DF